MTRYDIDEVLVMVECDDDDFECYLNETMKLMEHMRIMLTMMPVPRVALTVLALPLPVLVHVLLPLAIPGQAIQHSIPDFSQT